MRLLLLDEATVGLDVKARADILSHVRQLVTEQGIGVLWATHLFDEIIPGDDLVVAGLFDSLNAQRSTVLNGLERVTRKQREAADKIRSDTLALQALQGTSPPDQPKIDELGNQLVWETRIFEDRRRVSARCLPQSTSGCLRSAAPSSKNWNSRTPPDS